MRIKYIPAGELDPETIQSPWILVLGGVTREGNRRARRAATTALDAGINVVWFDGFEETDPNSGERVPLEVGTRHDPQRSLVIVGFGNEEAKSLAKRLTSSHTLRKWSWSRPLWKYLIRRIGLMLRPRACWGTVRPDVLALHRMAPFPETVIYCDDFAITSAWYAGRLWRTVPISMTFDPEPTR